MRGRAPLQRAPTGAAHRPPPRRRRAPLPPRAGDAPPPPPPEDADDDAPPATGGNQLANTIRRKQAQVQAQLQELGVDALDARLRLAAEAPPRAPLALTRLIVELSPTGRPALVFELGRGPAARSAAELGARAAALAAAGADALAVPTDPAETPEGLADLFAVVRAAPRLPVLRRDWYIHPIQLVDAKEAGAAGALGVLASVTGAGTPLLSGYAAALGLDCPVEVVNNAELAELEPASVPFYGVNLSIALSVNIAGFGASITKGLLANLPFGAISLAGARTVDEARAAREAGADALFIRRELVDAFAGREGELVHALRCATDGDD